MAKNITLAGLIVCLTFVFSVGADGRSDDRRIESIRELYTGQIGVQEATGKNDGPVVQMYLKSSGLQGNHPWCGAFVNWVLKTCGVSPRAKYSARARAWFETPERLVINKDKTVDWQAVRPTHLFALYYNNLGRIGHVGFIDEVNESSVITVEGNTNGAGAREGNGVWRKRRMKRSIYRVSNWTY